MINLETSSTTQMGRAGPTRQANQVSPTQQSRRVGSTGKLIHVGEEGRLGNPNGLAGPTWWSRQAGLGQARLGRQVDQARQCNGLIESI